MILRVLLPVIEANLPRAVVERWHVSEGSEVRFGDPLCDLAVTDIVRLRTEAGTRANALIRTARRKKQAKSYMQEDSGRFHVTYQLIASEPATILRIVAGIGQAIEPGDLVAVAGAEADEHAPDEAVASAPAMRVVTKISEGGEHA